MSTPCQHSPTLNKQDVVLETDRLTNTVWVIVPRLTSKVEKEIALWAASYPGKTVQCVALFGESKGEQFASRKHDSLVSYHAVQPSQNHSRLLKGTYYFAKQWVDSVMPPLMASHPNVFQVKGTPYDLQGAFEYTLQLDIARQGAECLLGVIEQLEAERPDTVFWHPDVYYIQQDTLDWLSSDFSGLSSISMSVLEQRAMSSVSYGVSYLKRNAGFALNQLKYGIRSLFNSFGSPAESHRREGARRVLTYARSDHHLRILSPSLDGFKSGKSNAQVVFANYVRDSIRERYPDLIDTTFEGYESFESIEPRDVPLRPDLLKTIYHHINQQCLRVSSSLRKERLGLLDQLLVISKQFCRLDAFSARYRPTDVLACMEADAFGIYLKELKKTYGYRLVNHLHGIAPYFYNQHLFSFDTFFVWNQLTADIEMADGYPDDGSLQVVGTPFWEGQQSLEDQLSEPEKVAKLEQWKGKSKLIGAYTAPPGIGYIDVNLRTAYLESLCDYLAMHPEVKLLIKKHPNEHDNVSESVLARRTDVAKRITLQGASELALYDSLYLVDVATAICSSVLMEALFYDVPTLAMDTTDMTRRLGYGMEKMMPVALTDEEAHGWLEQILEQGIQLGAYQVNDKQYYLPRFDRPYHERIQAMVNSL